MRAVFLDADTFGNDIDLKESFASLGDVTVYRSTSYSEVADRIRDCEILMLNKVRLDEGNLKDAKNLKIICVSATGYDPIDIEYCRSRKIAVCNVVGYSTDSVAQVTVAMALSLLSRMSEFCDFTASGKYSQSGCANKIMPFNELAGKTWGIVGLGNIGKKVAAVAQAFGCKVLAHKRTPDKNYNCVDLDTLCKEADIISVHTPLNGQTRGLIGAREIALMKKSAILVNVARGAVTDESALAQAVQAGKIAGLGADVYSVEPFGTEHPFYEIKDLPNVCLTPHMAWGSVEARRRCIAEMIENANTFFVGRIRNRVDM